MGLSGVAVSPQGSEGGANGESGDFSASLVVVDLDAHRRALLDSLVSVVDTAVTRGVGDTGARVARMLRDVFEGTDHISEVLGVDQAHVWAAVFQILTKTDEPFKGVETIREYIGLFRVLEKKYSDLAKEGLDLASKHRALLTLRAGLRDWLAARDIFPPGHFFGLEEESDSKGNSDDSSDERGKSGNSTDFEEVLAEDDSVESLKARLLSLRMESEELVRKNDQLSSQFVSVEAERDGLREEMAKLRAELVDLKASVNAKDFISQDVAVLRATVFEQLTRTKDVLTQYFEEAKGVGGSEVLGAVSLSSLREVAISALNECKKLFREINSAIVSDLHGYHSLIERYSVFLEKFDKSLELPDIVFVLETGILLGEFRQIKSFHDQVISEHVGQNFEEENGFKAPDCCYDSEGNLINFYDLMEIDPNVDFGKFKRRFLRYVVNELGLGPDHLQGRLAKEEISQEEYEEGIEQFNLWKSVLEFFEDEKWREGYDKELGYN